MVNTKQFVDKGEGKGHDMGSEERTKTCFNFAKKGTCKFGDNCKFAHV